MNEQTVAQQISDALATIPWDVWKQIVEREPEFHQMATFAKRYPPGAFLTLMVIAGLNDYQLKGRAEVAYWPLLRKHLENASTPASPEKLCEILEPFYQKERLGMAKGIRLRQFLRSEVAKKLWTMTPGESARQLKKLWQQIALTMGQAPHKKTIVFSLKTLAIGLLCFRESKFDFSGIPVPVDSRLQRLTPSLNEEGVQSLWDTVLTYLHRTEKRLTPVHLDSFLWQYSGENNPQVYLEQLGVPAPKPIVDAFAQLPNNLS